MHENCEMVSGDKSGGCIWYNVCSPTKVYTGRENELEIIDKQWKESNSKAQMFFVAIAGLGGIGKSELAKNYAKTFYEIEKGHCIWIDAETNQTLLHSFQSLAENHLQLSLKDNGGNEKQLDVLLKELYNHLIGNKCLIILDNIEGYDNVIFKLLSDLASIQAPTVLKPFVLTTSRLKPPTKDVDASFVALELNILSEDATSKFFYQAFNLSPSTVDEDIHKAIVRLSARLQYYPLAMQQASAYINEKLSEKGNFHEAIVEYLDDMEKQTKSLLDHKIPKHENFDGVSKTTYLTWRITIEQIRKTPEIGNPAVKLLEILSLFSPDNISVDLLLAISAGLNIDKDDSDSRSVYNKSLQILSNYSMISLTNDKVSIHRLVQEVIRIDLQETGQLEILLEKLLTTIQQILEVNFKTKLNSFSVDQMVHVENIWEHAAKNTQLIIRHKEFPYFVCLKFYSCGKYRDSYDFSCRALNCLESSLGGDSREILQIKFCKGRALKGMGDYQLSLELMTDAYNKQKEVFGEQDEDSLMTAIGVGSVFWRIKKFDEAMQWYKNALVQREKISGKLHPQTVELKNNVASVLGNQGKYTEAVALYQQILEDAEPVLGTEHPELLITKHNLAVVKFHEKKYEEALNIFQQVLQVRQRVLDADHPLTLITAHWIANTYKLLNRTAEAIELARQVLQQREKMLGPRHPDTLATNNLLISLEI